MKPLEHRTLELVWENLENNTWDWEAAVLPTSGLHVSEVLPTSAGGHVLLRVYECVAPDGLDSHLSLDALSRSISVAGVRNKLDELLHVLKDDDLVELDGGRLVRLTENGRILAEFLLRRSNIVRAQQPYAMIAGV